MALLIGGSVATGLLATGYIIGRAVSGDCSKPELQADFDINSYLGLWYEFQRSESVPFESGTCIQACYSLDGVKVNVQNS